jgi:uncharacterized membrane protein
MRGPLRWLLKSFLKGLLLVVPLTVTAWVFWFVFSKIDGLLRFDIPGLGFLVTLAIIVVAGALGSNFIVDRLIEWMERAVSRVPVAKLVYFSLKDFVGAFVGEKKGFNRPVLVSLGSDAGVKVLGFVTAETPEIPNLENHVAVYLQQSYNFAGNLVLVPRDRVTLLDPKDSSKWLTFIVSGGVSGGGARPSSSSAPSSASSGLIPPP